MKNFLQDSTQVASIVESSIDPSTTIKNYGVVGTHSSLLAHGRTRIFQAVEESHFVLAHNHASDLFCVVLKGEVYHNVFEEDPQGKPYLICEQTGSLGEYQYQGTVTKNFIRNYNAYEAGESYSLEAAEFHTISFAEGTSVLIVEGEPKGLKREVLFPMIDGAGYNPAEGGTFIQKPKRVEILNKNLCPEINLVKLSKFNFIEKIDGMKIVFGSSTEGLKDTYKGLSEQDREKIEVALSGNNHRHELRKMLREDTLEAEQAKNVVDCILGIEEVDFSNEFAVLIREVLKCNGYRFDYFQDVFDKLYKPYQIAIIGALQNDSKQRLSGLINNYVNLGEPMEALIIEMRKYLR